MLDKELEQTLNSAFKLARDKHHEFMTVEHLFAKRYHLAVWVIHL